MRASTTREELERADRRGVRADDLGVPDELLHRSDDEDEWEEQELDAGDYGHLAYDVVDAEDDPNAFEFDDEFDELDDGAPPTKNQKNQKTKRSKGGARKEKPRRMTAAERAGLVDTHKAHLLCLIARAAAYDRAASSPLARAMAASVVPREIAFAFEFASRDAIPARDDVARVAKWFAGHVDLVKAGTKGSRGPGFEHGSGRAVRVGESKGAKAINPGGVIVLDESSDEDGPADADGNPPLGEQKTPRHQPPPPDDDDDDPDARRARTRAEAIEAAHESSRTSPTLRLCFALANRAATQEEAAALFVAALRGLGCEARTCVALTPVPLRASAASLERAGILLPQPAELWTVDGVSRSRKPKAKDKSETETETETIKAKCKAKAKAKAKIETEGAPSAETNAIPTRFAEPVTHWAEVLCRDEGGEIDTLGAWVTVVPHSARGRRESNERWSFRCGRASVDDPGVVAASRDSPVMPYVFGFRSRLVASSAEFGSSADRRPLLESGTYRWGAKDLTRKYAETFSRVGPHRVDESWLRSTTSMMAKNDRAVDEFRASDDVQSSDRRRLLEVSALARGACRSEDVHMDAKCLTERVPSSFAELRGHPLWAVERFLTKTQCIHPRFPVKGFVQGECVFPRSCVRELRSAERWKAECRRIVLVSELQKPAKRTHSRIQAARARARRAKKDAARAQSRHSSDGRLPTGKERGPPAPAQGLEVRRGGRRGHVRTRERPRRER